MFTAPRLHSEGRSRADRKASRLKKETVHLSLCFLSETTKIAVQGSKKNLHDPDNHNGVITHLEPDILECEVKWALGSITTNKAGGDI